VESNDGFPTTENLGEDFHVEDYGFDRNMEEDFLAEDFNLDE